MLKKVIVALVLLLLPMAAWSVETLPNYSFEDGFTNGVADGWQKFTAHGGSPVICTMSTEAENVHTGNTSQKIDAVLGNQIGGVCNTVDTVVGNTYTYSVWVRSTAGPNGDPWETSYLAIFKNGNTVNALGELPDGDSGTEWVFNVNGVYLGNVGVWEQLTWTGAATHDKTTVALYVYKGGVSYFDDAMPSIATAPTTIADILRQPDDTDIVLTSRRIIASNPAFPTGTFYVEEMDRSAGIRVVGTGTRLKGDEISISGKVKTNADGERYIDAPLASDIVFLYEGKETPEMLCVTGRDLGGMAFSESTPGVYQGKGLYNVGKLVSVFGKAYKPAGSAPGYFYLDDGSGLNDGNSDGFPGVRIEMGTWTIPAGNNFVVTGISTMKMVNGNSVRAVRPLSSTSTNIRPF